MSRGLGDVYKRQVGCVWGVEDVCSPVAGSLLHEATRRSVTIYQLGLVCDLSGQAVVPRFIGGLLGRFSRWP